MGLLVHACVLFFTNGVLIAAQTCGELHPTYTITDDTMSCDIELVPSSYMSEYIKRDKLYRWNRYSNSGSGTVIDKERNVTINPDKFTETGLTLHIRTLTPEDKDSIYVVECRMDINEKYETRSNQITITLPERSTAAVTTSLTTKETTVAISKEETSTHGILGSDQNTGNTGSPTISDYTSKNNTGLAMIVVAICVVVVVALVAITIIIVHKRKQAIRHDNHGQRLVITEESSVGNQPREASESVYNEIDIDITQSETCQYTHYSEIDAKISNKSPLVSRDISPRLPKRPNEKAITSDNHYSTISVRENIQNKEDEDCNYASVLPKSQRNTESKDNASKPDVDASQTKNDCEYAKVIPKSQREAAVSQCNSQMNIKKEKAVSDKENNNEFTVQFPNINCDAITGYLAETTNDAGSESRRAEYGNIPRRSKRHMSKNRKNELLYIEIDHSGSELDLHNEFKSHLDTTKLDTEYTSIDFDRKAFVAPIRKPPSSWYKRRNKKHTKK